LFKESQNKDRQIEALKQKYLGESLKDCTFHPRLIATHRSPKSGDFSERSQSPVHERLYMLKKGGSPKQGETIAKDVSTGSAKQSGMANSRTGDKRERRLFNPVRSAAAGKRSPETTSRMTIRMKTPAKENTDGLRKIGTKRS